MELRYRVRRLILFGRSIRLLICFVTFLPARARKSCEYCNRSSNETLPSSHLTGPILHFFRNITKIRDLGQVLYEERGLLYNAAQNLTDIKLLLTSPTTTGTADHIATQHWTDHIVVNTTKLAWQHLAFNKTSVFLHVLLTRSVSSSASREVINSKVFSSGEALHGVVGMVKYDKIPRSFRQRYLLSDFGWVNISALEGNTIV